MLRILRLLIVLVIVVPLTIAAIQPSPAQADEPNSKISSSLELLISAQDSAGAAAPEGFITDFAHTGDVMVFIYTDRAPDTSMLTDLEAKGVIAYPESWIPPVESHPRGYMLASVSAGNVRDLASLSYVGWIDSAEMTSYPTNDVAAQTVGTSTFWSGGFDGSGVRITVIDSGLDTTHSDIPTPVYSKDYSQYPILGDNIRGSGGHGTHVTGSALGRGTLSADEKYRGMAPGAELVFLKIEREPPLKGATNAAMTAAIKAATDTYKTNIITMSYGGWSDFHDGSEATCQAVDYADSKGVPVFVSAGNEADKGAMSP